MKTHVSQFWDALSTLGTSLSQISLFLGRLQISSMASINYQMQLSNLYPTHIHIPPPFLRIKSNFLVAVCSRMHYRPAEYSGSGVNGITPGPRFTPPLLVSTLRKYRHVSSHQFVVAGSILDPFFSALFLSHLFTKSRLDP